MIAWIGMPDPRSTRGWRKRLFTEGKALAKRGAPCPKHPAARRGWLTGGGDIYDSRMAGYASLRCESPGFSGVIE